MLTPQADNTARLGMPYPRNPLFPPSINRYSFLVTHTMQELIDDWRAMDERDPTGPYEYMLHNLEYQSGCEPYIILPSNLDPVTNEPKKYRRLYVGYQATNRDIIQKILTFYEHKTIRRCMRRHLYWTGFTHQTDINGFSSHGPLKADMTLMNRLDDIVVV